MTGTIFEFGGECYRVKCKFGDTVQAVLLKSNLRAKMNQAPIPFNISQVKNIIPNPKRFTIKN